MSDLQLIKFARGFIVSAHKGQMWGGMPHSKHSTKVANDLDSPTVVEYVAALLHDVINFTEFTEIQMRELFDDDIVDVLCLFNNDPKLSDWEYNTRIINSGNIAAIKVKLSANIININTDKSHMTAEYSGELLQHSFLGTMMLRSALEQIHDTA